MKRLRNSDTENIKNYPDTTPGEAQTADHNRDRVFPKKTKTKEDKEMTYNYYMRKEAKEAAKEFINNQSPLWAVGWIVPADTQDDKKQKWSICAVFSAPFEAEIFIDGLPQENRDRFFITRL